MNSNKIIKIDCDGVLRDMLPAMCSIYNDYYDDNLTPKDVTDYDVKKVFNKCPDPNRFFFREHSDYIYLNSKPCKMAKEAVEMLREKGYTIAIVTDQPTFETQYYTLQWLKDNQIYYDTIVFTKDKKMINGDITIDDNPNVLSECYEKEKILIDAPHNRNDKRFKRFNTLFEYVETINN
jgi:5'(3')-deoxyribonucleotidase